MLSKLQLISGRFRLVWGSKSVIKTLITDFVLVVYNQAPNKSKQYKFPCCSHLQDFTSKCAEQKLSISKISTLKPFARHKIVKQRLVLHQHL